MTPIVFLDTNSLRVRKPLSNANSRMIQALSRSGQIRLVVPDVVLHELSRQWAEEAEENAEKLALARKSLNETLDELGDENLVLQLPSLDRERFYQHARQLLTEKRAEIPATPSVSTEYLLNKDLNVTKPFSRDGKGFRDALIWETIRALCDDLENTSEPTIFVTNNHTDFCEERGGRLHQDLRKDLATGREVEVLPSLHHLLQHVAIKPLVESHREIESQLQRDRLEELIDLPVAELHGRDVEDVVGVYVGSGLFEVPVTTGLDGATFDEIMPDPETLGYDIYRDGDESTVRVSFEADCSFDGFIDKANYFMDEGNSYALFEDWNDHMFRVGSSGRVRFVFSGTTIGTSLDNLVLTLDEAEDVFE